MANVNAQIENLPTDLINVNQAVLEDFLVFVAEQVRKAGSLDEAEKELRSFAAPQDMFVYRGGNHIALHMFSGHPARMMMVTEA